MQRPSVSIRYPGRDGEPDVEYITDDAWTVAICRVAFAFAALANDGDDHDRLCTLAGELITNHWCSTDCNSDDHIAARNNTPWQDIDRGFIRIELEDSASRISVRPPRRVSGAGVR